MTHQEQEDNLRRHLVVVGMQWGDEGKGKIVDLLCPAFDAVVRYQGGNNAGHTVKFRDQHYALHLIPSGILFPGMRCFLGNGMVIPPRALEQELTMLEERGVSVAGRLFVSDRAQVLGPAHAALDRAREEAAGKSKIGTTSRGIGPAYETKASRFGLRVGDLWSSDLEERLRRQLERLTLELDEATQGEQETLDLDQLLDEYDVYRRILSPFVTDCASELHRLMREGRRLLFEGAQGTLLDVDHGTYPFVTSSNSTAGGACTGSGVPPTAIQGVLGILKAYTTRVGAGPFPTELLEATGEQLRDKGGEFGTTTGRPRRCGWLDLVIGRYATRVNGIRSIALMKLDVLDGLDEIKVCTAYRIDGGLTEDFPADLSRLARVEPVYETLPGWQESTVGAHSRSDLPPQAVAYVDFIADQLGASIDLVSTGAKREETMVCGGVLGEWTGQDLVAVAQR